MGIDRAEEDAGVLAVSGRGAIAPSSSVLGADLPDAALAQCAATELTPAQTHIRGIASTLAMRALVLVDNQNRLVPISSEQQWELQQQIVQEVAEFAYQRRQLLQYQRQRQQPLPPQGDRPTLSPWCVGAAI
ncbi:MAG: hypothetical protein HC857_13620 [Synechococcales cyanobacterium RU_4_20]|nr:hypothetical protein [Synechococcales cyanobacterium RU_4_20]